MPEKNTLLLAGADDEGRRLDRILRKALPNMPLSGIHRLLRQGEVSVDGVPGKAADRIKAGANIRLPNPGRTQRAPGRTPAEAVKTIILWESPDLLILNKPPGLIVHGPDSLDDLVQAYLADRLPPSLSFKPGPLHRLDKPTSGILAFSKTLAGAQYFSGSIHQLRKVYIALADGPIESPAVWNEPLLRDKTARKTFIPENPGEGRPAETLIRPLAVGDRYSLIEAEIRTGRTHQIRAHAGFHGHPLAGDRKYGGSPPGPGFFLHAYTLAFPEFPLPGLPSILRAPLPEGFRAQIRRLFPGPSSVREVLQ